MDKILFTKEYRTRTYFYLIMTLMIMIDMTYGFIHPEHYSVLTFFAAFRSAELYQIKKFFSEKVYLIMFYIINIISVIGTIYFYLNNYTEHYNTFMFFMLGAFNTLFHFNKDLQGENEEPIKTIS